MAESIDPGGAQCGGIRAVALRLAARAVRDRPGARPHFRRIPAQSARALGVELLHTPVVADSGRDHRRHDRTRHLPEYQSQRGAGIEDRAMNVSNSIMTVLLLAIFSTMVFISSGYPPGARFMTFVVGLPAI